MSLKSHHRDIESPRDRHMNPGRADPHQRRRTRPATDSADPERGRFERRQPLGEPLGAHQVVGYRHVAARGGAVALGLARKLSSVLRRVVARRVYWSDRSRTV